MLYTASSSNAVDPEISITGLSIHRNYFDYATIKGLVDFQQIIPVLNNDLVDDHLPWLSQADHAINYQRRVITINTLPLIKYADFQ